MTNLMRLIWLRMLKIKAGKVKKTTADKHDKAQPNT